MEIEVGEYVRLARRQGINKIIEIDEDYYALDSEIADEWGDITDFIKEEKLQEEILKHSKNIIDLIEVGDIIKIGKEKYEIIYDESYEKLGILIPNKRQLAVRHCSIEYIFSKEGIKEFGIITILTHEQFEQNCYRLEEK